MTTDALWNCNWFTKNKIRLDCRQLFLAYRTQTGIESLVLFSIIILFFLPLLLKERGKSEQCITQNKGFMPSSIICTNTRDCPIFLVYKEKLYKSSHPHRGLQGTCTCLLEKKPLHLQWSLCCLQHCLRKDRVPIPGWCLWSEQTAEGLSFNKQWWI